MDLGTHRVGPISVGLALLLLALVLAAVWLARHPRTRRTETPGRLVTLLDHALSPLRERFGVQTVTVVAGLVGLIVVGALALGFTALLDDVLEGEGFAAVDEPAAHWLVAHREVWLSRVLLVITRLGNADAQAVWLTLVCLLAAWRARSWAPILLGLAGGGGIAAVIVIAKHLVGRQRPHLTSALVEPHGFSFPSGHATGAATVGLLCAWMLCRWVVHRWSVQVAVWTATIAMVGLIGFSRPYVGVHFVTDVLAGWLLGAAWTGSVLLLASWWSVRSRPGDRRPRQTR